jgi:hypothetical protein
MSSLEAMTLSRYVQAEAGIRLVTYPTRSRTERKFVRRRRISARAWNAVTTAAASLTSSWW